ncbi:hypothetical protein GOBAR_AA07061 [Gossypium barbadense]|uniref:Uncharacterized protein n=1 Tax=Gossypium barbadense TaxID=3634 RepID=A0A2P5YD37_GOSBA|nr:hypothetical protein GOBAR_AA07061 [Gossypium barbadense]
MDSNVSFEFFLSSWSFDVGKQEIHYYKLESRMEKTSRDFMSLELSLTVGNISTKTDERKLVFCYKESKERYCNRCLYLVELSFSMNKPFGVETGHNCPKLWQRFVVENGHQQPSTNPLPPTTHYQQQQSTTNFKPFLNTGGCSNNYKLKINDALTLATTSDNFTSKKKQTMGKPTNRNNRNKVEIVTKVRLHGDPWCIKKKLDKNYLRNMSRLILPLELVESYILSHWNIDQLAQIEEGLPVLILDCNTHTEHEIKFKRRNNGANVLIKNWITQFDEISICWDIANSRFNFSVLNRASMLYQ